MPCSSAERQVAVQAVADPDIRRYRTADAADIVGMNAMQIHHVAKKKLQLADWRVGYGRPRPLSLRELFVFRVAAETEKLLPPVALRNLAACATDYLKAVTFNPALRDLPAVIVGYTGPGDGWWFLLGHSGKWPDNPPDMVGRVMIVLRVREMLLDVLTKVGALGELPAEAIEPTRPGDDLLLAATAFAKGRSVTAGAAA